MSTDLETWALPRLTRLLPIDESSLKEVITYSASLSKVDGAEHLKNLLGDSAQSLEFISSFNSRRAEVAQVSTTSNASSARVGPPPGNHDDGPSPRKRAPKKASAPLHNAGPVRRPEQYGNVTGGYHKSVGEDYMPGGTRNIPSSTSLSNALSLSQEPAALQLPKTSQILKTPSPASSRDPSPPRQKAPPSASGMLISDLPNVKTKQSKKTARSGSSTPLKATTATTSSINDLTSAIATLELSTNPALSSERRRCPCNASIHPLFSPAPNCLSCGKIICALEGLQPCSFCDSPILTREQVNNMIRALKEERGQEKIAAHNASVSHSGRGTPSFGGFGGTTPESSGDEGSGAAARARAHRDRLLAFQKENVQRTKVHDEAADYDMTVTPGATQWMSPLQRAAALKKQQKYLREMEEQSKPEWERKKTVMSMSIKNGKLVRTYEKMTAPERTEADSDQDEVGEETTLGESSGSAQKGAFSDNPLLADGHLLRPIWKAPDGLKGKDEESSRKDNKWRRVQDDNDDNEQWILDGGVHGYAEGEDEVGR